jgi:hypothetical protein
MGFTFLARGKEFLERSISSSRVGFVLQARDCNGAKTHSLNPDSGMQGCPKSMLGFLT